jgi:Icc protein
MDNLFNKGTVQVGRHIRQNGWQIIMLDSMIPKQNGGRLEPEELSFLESCLQSEPFLHTLVCLHHNPIPMESHWMDSMMLNNAIEFFHIINHSPNVKGILWGHVHQEFEKRRKEQVLMATPSTSIQFTPQSYKFSIDTAAPGYRWLHLNSDGSIDTGVRRLQGFSFIPDLTMKGY